MISCNRIIEREPFLETVESQDFSKYNYLYPTLRQGIYQYFKKQSINSVLLPDYVPEGIFDPFKKLGVKIIFYHINNDLSISIEEIKEKMVKYNIKVFVYIHYFGLYHEKNILQLKKEIPSNTIFIEDFAHTIYSQEIAIVGDIALYSFPKVLGIHEGSLMLFKNKSLFFKKDYDKKNVVSKLLEIRLYTSLCIENILAKLSISPKIYWLSSLFIRKFNKIIGHREDNIYYDYLIRNYTKINCEVSKKTISTLNKLNLEKIAQKRKMFAELYLSGLHESFLFLIPKSYYLSNALYAFPIIVKDTNLFKKYLFKNGIVTSNHTSLWWFTADIKQESFFYHHCLLPINHYLSFEHIQKIIRIVNEFDHK